MVEKFFKQKKYNKPINYVVCEGQDMHILHIDLLAQT